MTEHLQDMEVSYEDSTHTYYHRGLIYRSATQVVDKFRNRFDTLERSAYMADRYGGTAEYWQEQWRDSNRQSLVRGNSLHDAKEDFLYGRGFDRLNGKDFQVRNNNLYTVPSKQWGEQVKHTPVPYNLLPDGTYPELKFWRHDYCIAGRADKPTFETIGTSRYLHIEDYKTNKRLHTESYQDNKTREYLMMLGPLSHLMDCEMEHYTLQLSLYQFMGEYFGFKPGIRRIIHYPHEIEGLGTPDPKIYELPCYRDEVIAALNHLTHIKWLKHPYVQMLKAV